MCGEINSKLAYYVFLTYSDTRVTELLSHGVTTGLTIYEYA